MASNSSNLNLGQPIDRSSTPAPVFIPSQRRSSRASTLGGAPAPVREEADHTSQYAASRTLGSTAEAAAASKTTRLSRGATPSSDKQLGQAASADEAADTIKPRFQLSIEGNAQMQQENVRALNLRLERFQKHRDENIAKLKQKENELAKLMESPNPSETNITNLKKEMGELQKLIKRYEAGINAERGSVETAKVEAKKANNALKAKEQQESQDAIKEGRSPPPLPPRSKLREYAEGVLKSETFSEVAIAKKVEAQNKELQIIEAKLQVTLARADQFLLSLQNAAPPPAPPPETETQDAKGTPASSSTTSSASQPHAAGKSIPELARTGGGGATFRRTGAAVAGEAEASRKEPEPDEDFPPREAPRPSVSPAGTAAASQPTEHHTASDHTTRGKKEEREHAEQPQRGEVPLETASRGPDVVVHGDGAERREDSPKPTATHLTGAAKREEMPRLDLRFVQQQRKIEETKEEMHQLERDLGPAPTDPKAPQAAAPLMEPSVRAAKQKRLDELKEQLPRLQEELRTAQQGAESRSQSPDETTRERADSRDRRDSRAGSVVDSDLEEFFRSLEESPRPVHTAGSPAAQAADARKAAPPFTAHAQAAQATARADEMESESPRGTPKTGASGDSGGGTGSGTGGGGSGTGGGGAGTGGQSGRGQQERETKLPVQEGPVKVQLSSPPAGEPGKFALGDYQGTFTQDRAGARVILTTKIGTETIYITMHVDASQNLEEHLNDPKIQQKINKFRDDYIILKKHYGGKEDFELQLRGESTEMVYKSKKINETTGRQETRWLNLDQKKVWLEDKRKSYDTKLAAAEKKHGALSGSLEKALLESREKPADQKAQEKLRAVQAALTQAERNVARYRGKKATLRAVMEAYKLLPAEAEPDVVVSTAREAAKPPPQVVLSSGPQQAAGPQPTAPPLKKEAPPPAPEFSEQALTAHLQQFQDAVGTASTIQQNFAGRMNALPENERPSPEIARKFQILYLQAMVADPPSLSLSKYNALKDSVRSRTDLSPRVKQQVIGALDEQLSKDNPTVVAKRLATLSGPVQHNPEMIRKGIQNLVQLKGYGELGSPERAKLLEDLFLKSNTAEEVLSKIAALKTQYPNDILAASSTADRLKELLLEETYTARKAKTTV